MKQFKIGCELEGTSKDERAHRETRFHDSLTNFDKAHSLAKPEEKAFELSCKADSLIDAAKENEIKASKIKVDELPKGL